MSTPLPVSAPRFSVRFSPRAPSALRARRVLRPAAWLAALFALAYASGAVLSRLAISSGRSVAATTRSDAQQHASHREAAGATACRRVALLHKGSGPLTARGLHAALRAKAEVEAGGGWYGFLYSLHPGRLPPSGPPGGTQAAISLDLLRRTLGLESVFALGRGEVEAALGAALLEEQRRVVGEAEWAWATNDAVEAAWCGLVQERPNRWEA